MSRTKLGLFIFGNANCIREYITKQLKRDQIKTLWFKVLFYLSEKNLIIDQIEFSCALHKKEVVVKSKNDFKNVAKNGCNQKCLARLECGHSCSHPCHVPFEITLTSPDGHLGLIKNAKVTVHENILVNINALRNATIVA